MPTSTDLRRDLDSTGYYPELVADVLGVAIAGEEVVAHLVQAETTFDAAEVIRHETVLVLTLSRLVTAHIDDHEADAEHPQASAMATTEAVPLAEIRSVALTHVVDAPADHHRAAGRAELSLAIGWGAVSRVDLEPARCDDPHCEADHGLTGSVTPDDLVVRVSAAVDGVEAVRAAVDFARRLSAATARRR